jgi:hypothetical protein
MKAFTNKKKMTKKYKIPKMAVSKIVITFKAKKIKHKTRGSVG